MRARRILTLASVLLIALALTGMAAAQLSQNYDAVWSRFAGGGGERQASSTLVLDMTGQWVFTGSASLNNRIVPDFFWEGDALSPVVGVYLPMIFRP